MFLKYGFRPLCGAPHNGDVNEYSKNGFSDSMKIEIYTHSIQAKEIALVLADIANDMTEGGGVVAIEPVLKLMNVRKIKS
jgi:hypothetical protein